jgi:hypothetical protein
VEALVGAAFSGDGDQVHPQPADHARSPQWRLLNGVLGLGASEVHVPGLEQAFVVDHATAHARGP